MRVGRVHRRAWAPPSTRARPSRSPRPTLARPPATRPSEPHVRPAVGHGPDRRPAGPRGHHRQRRTSSSACWTAASPAPTPTWRPRSPRTRARPASAVSSTPPRRPGTRPPRDHGTHVAGTIAAAINGVGVTGVAPGVKVAAVKVVNDDGYIYPEAAVCGFMWAADARHADHQQQLLHRPVGAELPQRRPAASGVAGRAARHPLLAQQGVLNVASAGNSNSTCSTRSPTRQPERRDARPGEPHQRLPGPAGRGAGRGDRRRRSARPAEELLLLVRPGRRRRDGAGWRHPLPYRRVRARPPPTASCRPPSTPSPGPTAGVTSRAPRCPARTRPASRRWPCRRTRA